MARFSPFTLVCLLLLTIVDVGTCVQNGVSCTFSKESNCTYGLAVNVDVFTVACTLNKTSPGVENTTVAEFSVRQKNSPSFMSECVIALEMCTDIQNHDCDCVDGGSTYTVYLNRTAVPLFDEVEIKLSWEVYEDSVYTESVRNLVCQSTCEPAEEGQSYNVECSVPRDGPDTVTVAWIIRQGAEEVYCSCTSGFSNCLCENTDYTARMQQTTNGYITVLSVVSPRANDTGTTIVCQNSGIDYVTCDLRVVVRAKNPRCQVQDPGPTSNTDVVVTCQDNDIFPAAACLFEKKTNSNPSSEMKPGTNVAVKTAEKTCTLTVDGTYLGRGQHQFSVVMYPSITNVSYGISSPYTDIITIDYPSAQLTKCPTVIQNNTIKDGYIKEGTVDVTCTCTRTDQTYFPVDISWKNKNGGTVSSVSQQDQSVILTFTAARDQFFTCSVTNSLQWTKEVAFTPKVSAEDKSEVNIGAVVGGVVAGTCAVVAVVVAVICVSKKRRGNSNSACNNNSNSIDVSSNANIASPYENQVGVGGGISYSQFETIIDDEQDAAYMAKPTGSPYENEVSVKGNMSSRINKEDSAHPYKPRVSPYENQVGMSQLQYETFKDQYNAANTAQPSGEADTGSSYPYGNKL